MAEILLTIPQEAEERLDNLFSAAFGVDHPAMIDWVSIKFELKRLRKLEGEANGRKPTEEQGPNT